MKNLSIALAAAISGFFVIPAHSADVTGAGSTFAAPIYNKWAEAYVKAGGVRWLC